MFRDLPALISEVDIIRHEITPKIILIDQNSMFMRRWDCVMLLCLVFVAIVTPFEVSFMKAQMFTALWWFNRLVDIFFVIDMVLNFFVKAKIKEKGGYRVLRNRRQIAKHYVRTWCGQFSSRCLGARPPNVATSCEISSTSCRFIFCTLRPVLGCIGSDSAPMFASGKY